MAGIVDELVALRRNPRILHGAWQVDVEYTDRTGAKVVAYLTRAQLAEWRARQ